MDGILGTHTLPSIWLIDKWEGEPTNLQLEEHDGVGWFSLEELLVLDLALAHPDYVTLFAELVFS